VVEWTAARDPELIFTLPVVAETADALLNDMNGFHVHREDALAALDSATAGPVAEGNVGGGTGMICFGFKGGIGTASRVVAPEFGGYTVGVLAQCNAGERSELRIDGVPVGREIPDLGWCYDADEPPVRAWVRAVVPRCGEGNVGAEPNPLAGMGSIIIVVATDAPLLPHQLKRLARRAALGLGMVGGQGENGSGDLMLAFSTANPGAWEPQFTTLTMFPNQWMDVLFSATIEATQEAIVNAMLAAETMTGADAVRVFALPHDRLREIMRRYNRLATNN
jgi:L-aminopeptidase/D-esterase-like protein